MTFIVPTSEMGHADAKVWYDLYADEATWLSWALSK